VGPFEDPKKMEKKLPELGRRGKRRNGSSGREAFLDVTKKHHIHIIGPQFP